MRRFIESFLEARVKYLPLPEPTLPSTRVDDPDSQDYGNFDFGIDLNDPTLLAQLEGQENSFSAIREQEKSGELLQKVCHYLHYSFSLLIVFLDHLSLFLGLQKEDPAILRSCH